MDTVYLSPLLSEIPSLRHAFFTRQWGVSQGLFYSLNAKYCKEDSTENVHENRRRMADYLGIQPINLVGLKQIHSTIVHCVNKPFERGEAPDGDALVTTTSGLALGILTADCVPVLLVDPYAKVIGAVHAGWRGTVAGILGETLSSMKNAGANIDHILAAIGPCIWQDSYEVGDDMKIQFKDGDPFFKKGNRPGHWQFDLPRYVLHKLRSLGIRQISPSPADTCSNPDLFFSNRRRTLQNEAHYGCMLSCIALE